ncbi:hypothetical protein B0H14DRAFT_791162 [Mycena olivaceomarginata]|nr:hypothetical protein B0H14DRAFT_791162 [Mycena olivaceomarginata]
MNGASRSSSLSAVSSSNGVTPRFVRRRWNSSCPASPPLSAARSPCLHPTQLHTGTRDPICPSAPPSHRTPMPTLCTTPTPIPARTCALICLTDAAAAPRRSRSSPTRSSRPSGRTTPFAGGGPRTPHLSLPPTPRLPHTPRTLSSSRSHRTDTHPCPHPHPPRRTRVPSHRRRRPGCHP